MWGLLVQGVALVGAGASAQETGPPGTAPVLLRANKRADRLGGALLQLRGAGACGRMLHWPPMMSEL
jgi:hypothetical protein